ncbi:hypothetical protein JTE90_017753 [Oedothorax gibbosus]|uniref:RNA-directed DNA polymerase n=1 Tax=Oedothorax gibbosus TaxID=931172 RepID=A0AAV6UMR3_9ARAC|nr:hypothetical protein JTE90_017753 [Oedothorax gibbosus]
MKMKPALVVNNIHKPTLQAHSEWSDKLGSIFLLKFDERVSDGQRNATKITIISLHDVTASIIIGASVWDYGADSACDAPLYFEVVSSGCTSIQRRAGEGRVIVLDFAVEKNGYASTREVPSEGHASVLEFAFESSGCTSIQRRAGEGRVIALDFAVEKSGYASTSEVSSEGHASCPGIRLQIKRVHQHPEKSRRGTHPGCTSIQRRAGEGHTRVLDFVFVPSGYFISSGCARHPQQRHRRDAPASLDSSLSPAGAPGTHSSLIEGTRLRLWNPPSSPAGAPGTHGSCIERTRLRLWAPISSPAGEPAPQQLFTEGRASVTGQCQTFSISRKVDNYDEVRQGRNGTRSNDKIEKKENFQSRNPRVENNKQPSNEESRNKRNVERFDRRKTFRCFECGNPNHMRYNCPNLLNQRKESGSRENVNFLKDSTVNPFLTPFLCKGSVNGKGITFLRDTGSSLDVVSRKYVLSDSYTGEIVWVKQPLDVNQISLPLAVVELSGEFGTIQTKAAVCADYLDEGRYILGNRTAVLIKETNGFEFNCNEQLNAMQTRSLTRRIESNNCATEPNNIHTENLEEHDDEINEVDLDEEPVEIPEVDLTSPEMSLINIKYEEFKTAQKNCPELKELFTTVGNRTSGNEKSNYEIDKGLLVKVQNDRMGNVKKLLVIPKELRERVKALCHEGTSAHMGTTKSKDKLTRYFFWPGCFKEMELFCKTCDQCQRAGKPNDKKKAPLKLVPVIQEVFSKINIDACGPLPVSPNGNRYIITAICMSSKYPEAIPVPDIRSVTVVEALLNVFSRMGFPRELQVDQGTSFTSVLTSEFFDRFGIKVRHSSVYHPQSNPVERFHRSLKRLLRSLCLEAGHEWEKHLPSALMALRTVTHESTGFSPAELVFGKNLRTPETLIYEQWLEPEEDNEPVTEYVFELINRLKRCQDLAIAKLTDSQAKNKARYDKNAIKREFREGDLVLVLATGKKSKMAVQWMGPGVIRKKVSDTNYVVERNGKADHIYHVNMLKPYYKRPEHVNLLVSEGEMKFSADQDLDFPFLDNNPDIYDFEDLIEGSDLQNRLDLQQIDQLRLTLNKFSKSFSNKPGLTHLVTHDIELTKEAPFRGRPYRASHRQNEILRCEIQRMLDMHIIEVGESDYVSPMILVEVPGKDPRACVDYRILNDLVRTEYFPLPNIEERVEQVAAAQYITVLDFSKGYWQISLSPRAQRLAAFCTSFGTYRPLRMCFGLKNAPFFFSKLMAELLKGCEEFAVPYLDDIAIFSISWELHLRHLNIVLERISKANLTIKPSKCKFAQNQVKYLGHVVGKGFRTPAEAKVQDVLDFKTPSSKSEIRAFLGLCGYYSRYIHNYSVIAAPLTDALKGKVKKCEVKWNEACEKAFCELKAKLTEKPVLYSPNFELEFIVQTDASDFGMGVVLSQRNSLGEEHPVLYLSKKFAKAELNYSTTEKECASIVFAIKKLHYYLDGRFFVIETDHNPLTWLRNNASSNPRLMRWALILQPYDFKIVHRSGKKHVNADGLSRIMH